MCLPNFMLNGKVAVITGGRRGIGKAIALTFAEAGADVAICDLVKDGNLEIVAEEIRKLGRRSIAVQADVTRKADVDNFINRATSELGYIDILVNNAGGGDAEPLKNTSEAEWDRLIDLNLKSCYLCFQAVAKGMIERRQGNIISMASGAGMRGFAGRNVYNIAKAGVIMFTRVVARDLGKYNIRANAIAPTTVHTDLMQWLWDDPKALAAEAARIPLGRLAEPDDITGPALFLASDASKYISGHTIVIDGGQLA